MFKVKFITMNLGPNCEEDYLKIHNGAGPGAPVMSHRCGRVVPPDIISQSSNVWIHFHSSLQSQFLIELSPVDSSMDLFFGSTIHY